MENKRIQSESGCYFCESTKNIEEHHIVPQRFDGSDEPTNIVDLCHSCHWKLERLYNKEFWEVIGIEDPRTTAESHISCAHTNCSEPAISTSYGSPPNPATGEHKPRKEKLPRCDVHVRLTGNGPYGLPNYEHWIEMGNAICDIHDTNLVWLTRDDSTEVNQRSTSLISKPNPVEPLERSNISYQEHVNNHWENDNFEGYRLKITCPETANHILSIPIPQCLTYNERRKTAKRIISNHQSLLH